MEYKQAKSLIAKFASQIKFLSVFVIALLIGNIVLGLLLWHQSGRKEIILIPANLYQKGIITHNSFNPAYLEAMAMMLVNNRLNVTPDNIAGSNQNVLAFVDPAFYASFKNQLTLDAKTIQTSKVSSSFYVTQIQANPINLSVTVYGQLKRWVGERLIGIDHKNYLITFSKNNNLLLLKSFQEMKAD